MDQLYLSETVLKQDSNKLSQTISYNRPSSAAKQAIACIANDQNGFVLSTMETIKCLI